MRAPTRDRLAFIFNRAWPFAPHSGFFKVRIAVVSKNWFTSEQWQRVLATLVAFYFQCFFGLLQSACGQIVGSKERKTPRRLFAVAAINPKLRVKAAVALVKAGDPAIA